MQLYEMGLPSQWAAALARAATEDIRVLSGSFCELPNGELVSTARVRSSDGSGAYVTKINVRSTGIFVGCTCKAGEHEVRCKHAASELVRHGILDPMPPAANPAIAAARAIVVAHLASRTAVQA